MQFVAHVLCRTEGAVAILPEGAEGTAREGAEHGSDSERERRVRRARLQWHRGRRDDARVGDREGLLLNGLLVALQEGLVEAFVVVGLALELTQGDELVVR